MNKINFANSEPSLRSKYSMSTFTALLLFLVVMTLIQAIVVAHWYFCKRLRAQETHISRTDQKHFDLIQARFEAAAPFLNTNKKTKLASLHKQGIHPELITIDQQGTTLTVAINETQTLKKTIQSIEQLLDTPVCVTTMQDRNNRRYISLTTGSAPDTNASRHTS